MELRNFQTVAVAGSLLLLGLVLELIRRRALKEELWVPWLLVGLAPLLAGLWIEPWARLAQWLEVRYEPILLVAGALALCLGMILYLTVVISTLMRQSLRLAQDVAMLRERVESLGAPADGAARPESA
jgi:hypothetical protein